MSATLDPAVLALCPELHVTTALLVALDAAADALRDATGGNAHNALIERMEDLSVAVEAYHEACAASALCMPLPF